MADRALKVVGFAGSLREKSYNRALLRTACELAPPAMAIDIFDLREDIVNLRKELKGN